MHVYEWIPLYITIALQNYSGVSYFQKMEKQLIGMTSIFAFNFVMK